MARTAVTTRQATLDDIPALLDLWRQLREEGLRRRSPIEETPEQTTGRFELAVADTASRIVVAVNDGEIVGMAQLTRTPPTLLTETSSVELSAMCVDAAHRRRGVGKALLAAAVAHADELGVENVVVSVLPQHREANRFYARLGFAPLVTRRIAGVASLRRRLGSPEGRAALLRRELHVPRRAARGRGRLARPVPAPATKRD